MQMKNCVLSKPLISFWKSERENSKVKHSFHLSFKRPFKETVSSTLSGCDMKVLELANMSTSVSIDIPLDQPLLLK